MGAGCDSPRQSPSRHPLKSHSQPKREVVGREWVLAGIAQGSLRPTHPLKSHTQPSRELMGRKWDRKSVFVGTEQTTSES